MGEILPPTTEWPRRGSYWYFVDKIIPEESPCNEPIRIRLWAALPQSRNGQDVRLLRIAPEPTEILEDAVGGNRAVYWSVENPDPGSTLGFRYDFEVINRSIEFDVDPARVQPVSKESPEARRYAVSETWLEASPEIAAKAREIVGEERNPCLQARLLFDWVVGNMTYDYPDMNDRGVTRAFERRKGDCGEFSHVFIAMARSLGIPARSVIACWYQDGGHAWAEVFLPPYGWIPVDTSGAQLVRDGLRGQLSEESVRKFMESRGIPTRDPRWMFGNLYPNRLEVFVGENVEFVAKAPGGTRTFTFMQPGGLAAWPPGILLDGLSSRTVHAGFFLFDSEAHDEVVARKAAEEWMTAGFLAAGLYERAIEALKRRLRRKPEDAASSLQLGQAYFNLGQYEPAMSAFRAALDGEGGSLKRTIHAWSRILLGMSLDALGRREEAVEEYKAAIAIGDDYQGALGVAQKFIGEPYRPDSESK